MYNINFLINSLGNGGAERVVLTLAKKFLEEGQRVRIISLTKSSVYDLPSGIEIVYLSTLYDENSSSSRRMLSIPLYAWRLKKIIKRDQIGLLQSHLFRSNYVNILSRLLGAKHKVQVVNHSVASRFLSSGLSGKLNLFLMKHLYPKADTIISISQRMLKDLRQLFDLSTPTEVIHNPYDIAMLLAQKDAPITEFEFDENKRYLITVGRLISLKQYEDVIHVLSRLSEDIELILLGEDGGSLGSLKKLSKKLNIEHRVHFLGQVDNPFKLVQASDVLVLSSRTEGFPNVLIEAMLCGTAVVSSDCISGPREILAPQTPVLSQLQEGIEEAEFGILYPVGDLDALEQALLRLLDDPEYLEKYAKKGHARSENFSVDTIAIAYKKILGVGM